MSGRSRERRPRRRTSERTREHLRELSGLFGRGLPWAWAALAVGVDETTARRWRRRERAGQSLVRRRGPPTTPQPEAARTVATQLVRDTHGLIGASALSHSVPGLTRRSAADLKHEACVAMERERRRQAQQVHVLSPGLVRGFDAMAVPHAHLLIAADACVPFRTSWARTARYDGRAVAGLLERDFATQGTPLVLRLDRAKAHAIPEVRDLLATNQVLALQGPPHYARFYGQLERQNLEHRRWLATAPTGTIDLDAMMAALNSEWRRSTLGWHTAAEMWARRPPITIDRTALAADVQERAWKLQHPRHSEPLSRDLAWRLAVKQALINRGLLRIEIGGWC